MTNTPFSKKCEIISDFADSARGMEWAKDYFDFYDLGVPFAIGVAGGYITVAPDSLGTEYIDEAWNGLCALWGVDSYGDYDSISELAEIANEQG